MRSSAMTALQAACIISAAVLWSCREERLPASPPASQPTDSQGQPAANRGNQEPPAAILVHSLQGVGVQYLLTPQRCATLGGPPGREFDIDPTGGIVIGNASGLLRITTTDEGIQADRLTESRPDSFSLDGQGSILSIVMQYFGQLEDSDFSRLVPLPYTGMRLMGSSFTGVAYLIGGNESQSQRVYAFFADGTLQIEAEVPEPVVAVADNWRAVYLASKHTLFRVTSNRIDVVARLPEHLGDITAVAAAADDKALYFATENETFVMSGLSAVALLPDLGGTIHMRNDKLYVWSPTRQVLAAVYGMPELLEKERGES